MASAWRRPMNGSLNAGGGKSEGPRRSRAGPRKKSWPGSPGGSGLRQLLLDAVEGVAQLAAEQRQHRGDGDGHERGDQAILDGGGAGLVLHEARNELGHLDTPSIDGQAAGGFSDTAYSPKRQG